MRWSLQPAPLTAPKAPTPHSLLLTRSGVAVERVAMQASTIPQSIIDLMWEYDRKGLLRLDEIPDVVIERVMLRATWAETRWLLKAVPAERLRSYLESRGSRVLPPREVRFWSWVAGVPDSEAGEWVRRARRSEALWRT